MEGSLRKGSSILFPARIAYVWAVVFVAIVFYSFAWFVNITWVWQVITALDPYISNLPAPLDSVVTVIKYVLALHPLFALLGWLFWGFINSMRRDVRIWEVG